MSPKNDPRAWPRWIARSVVEAATRPLQRTAVVLGEVARRLDNWRLTDLSYVPRSDDIFITTYPRSGTTWAQMILYQLTSDGSMDFAHISGPIPYLERLQFTGRDIESLPSPRIFKTHRPYPMLLKGPAKYLYIARDGKDVAVSCYHFAVSHFGFKGTFEQFFTAFLRGHVPFGSWFSHVEGFWAHRDELDLLFLRYEDLVRDLEGSIKKIARFCRLEVDPARYPSIVERCSFAFMRQHEAKFDQAYEMLWERGYTPRSFLRSGKSGEGVGLLSEEQRERFEQEFARTLGEAGPEMGLSPS